LPSLAVTPKVGAGVRGASSLGTERMVVLVGASHVRGRVGIPDRFTRRTQLPTFAIVPLSVPWSKATNRPARAQRPVAASEADWIVYTRPQPPEGLSLAASRELRRNVVYFV